MSDGKQTYHRLQSDLSYEPIRTVPPILKIIVGYAVPTTEQLTAMYTGKFFGVGPPMTADKKVCLSFFCQPPMDDLPADPTIEVDCCGGRRVADPILPVYYAFDAASRRIFAIHRLNVTTTIFSDQVFGDVDDRLSFCCPSSGIIYALDNDNEADRWIYRITASAKLFCRKEKFRFFLFALLFRLSRSYIG